mmetsp:Transcript_92304/g.239005  ORF Transcript_92304/g.239005 Transcript_92304/m.239005 type:complete len:137 (-) Transcript_92304:471-881(-)
MALASPPNSLCIATPGRRAIGIGLPETRGYRSKAGDPPMCDEEKMKKQTNWKTTKKKVWSSRCAGAGKQGTALARASAAWTPTAAASSKAWAMRATLWPGVFALLEKGMLPVAMSQHLGSRTNLTGTCKRQVPQLQ